VTDFALSSYLAAERESVEPALEDVVSWLESDLPPDVGAAIRHGVMGGGKRLRPILCATAYRACSKEDPVPLNGAVYALAAALELIHCYSLMHDDLPCMDDAELRRGQATTHVAHGEAATARAGAALIPAAALQALAAAGELGCGSGVAVEVARELMQAAGAGGMVGGQWLDLEGEGQELGGEQLDDLYGGKTGALLTASLVVGAKAAGAGGPVVEAMRGYGRAIGLAFQITDDILDATQSAETLGKEPSDAVLAKSTYVALYGLEKARERARAQVADAVRALDSENVDSLPLRALASYIVEREA
jgi:geranylgeranyl pyrophosphate synthase